MTLEELNALTSENAQQFFMQCCTSSNWIKQMVNARPFVDNKSLKDFADRCWKTLTESDYHEAFEGHPKIGDIGSLRARYASTSAMASNEQSSVNQASEEVIKALSRGNEDYLKKFGFIFIVCATGKSASEMLILLQARLGNSRDTELKNAAEEQRKIFQIRLDKCLDNN